MLKPPLQPMLLSNLDEPFNSEEYIFEFKWDGYRCLTFINDDKLFLQSRNKKDLSPLFPELNDLPLILKPNKVILDGEICALDKEGKPVFEALQGRLGFISKKIKHPVTLIVWDILSLNGEDIYHKSLLERKKCLNETIVNGDILQQSPFIEKEGCQLYNMAQKQNLEGIVAKKKDSPYEFKRSLYWYKIKTWNYMTVIIAGYSYDKTSLVVGNFNNKELKYMGKVKLKLSKEISEVLFKTLPQLEVKECPFEKDPGLSKIIWIKPVIKCKVRFTELTHNKTFRHGYVIELLID